jgi:hypothetical protein
VRRARPSPPCSTLPTAHSQPVSASNTHEITAHNRLVGGIGFNFLMFHNHSTVLSKGSRTTAEPGQLAKVSMAGCRGLAMGGMSAPQRAIRAATPEGAWTGCRAQALSGPSCRITCGLRRGRSSLTVVATFVPSRVGAQAQG